MITIKNLRDMLDNFSDSDLVEAYEFSGDEDISLWNTLGIFKGGPSWVQGKLPDSDEPIGHISTILSEATVFIGEADV